jgi:hypothetical protein
LSILLISCKGEHTDTKEPTPDASIILNDVILAYGGDVVKQATRKMTIGNKNYSIMNSGYNYEYKVSGKDSVNTYADVLSNTTGYHRFINEEELATQDGMKSRIVNLLEKHFFLLNIPYSFSDNFLKKEYVQETSYKENDYHVLSLSYKALNGKPTPGQYMVYVNKATYLIDYVIALGNFNDTVVQIIAFDGEKRVKNILFRDMTKYSISRSYFNTPDLYYIMENKNLVTMLVSKLENIRVELHP